MDFLRFIALVVALVINFLTAEIFSASKQMIIEASPEEVPSLELKLDSDPDNPVILQSLGRYYFRTENYDAARKCAIKLLDISNKTGDRELSEMWGRYLLGSIQFVHGEKDALRNLEIARGIAETGEDMMALGTVYNSLGLFYMFNNNDPFTATTYYYKALDVTHKTKNLKMEATVLANLAAAFLVMEDPSGLRIAEKAAGLAEKYNKTNTIRPRIILTQTYILSDSIAKAWKTLETIQSRETEADKEQFAPTLRFLEASLTLKEGRLDEGIKIFRSLLIHEDDPSWTASVSLELAAALEKKGLDSEAISVLERALNNSREKHVNIHSSKLMKALVRIYAKAGRKDDAISMGEEYVAYSDSLYTLGHHRTLQENRIREEVYAKERQIDEQNDQLASKNQKILLLSISLGFLLVLIILIYSSYIRREKIYKTIVVRNSEYIKRDRQQTEEIEALRQKAAQNFAESESKAADPENEQSKNDNTKELMSRFTAYMESNEGYADPNITIANVAKECGTNRTYLSKAINASTGKTFLQIVNDYRMRRAVELLSDKDTDIPLKQLASSLGYNSLSTFYTIFNNYTGMTPAKYREHARRVEE